MKAQVIIDALKIPENARVDQRIAKKLLAEQGAPTAADKRAIQDGLEEVTWIAALKPSSIGVPEFKDEAREYLEIAVVRASFRDKARSARLTELMHRAIPYPLFLIASKSGNVSISLVHKRASQGEAGAVVLDGDIIEAASLDTDTHAPSLLENLAITRQPTLNMLALYQGWIDQLHALLVARLTGSYVLTHTPDQALARQGALGRRAEIVREIELLRTRASKERQISRRVDINLAIQRLEDELRAVITSLQGEG